MSNMDQKNVEFKIAPPESLYIIGSGSIETSGDAFMMDVNSVSLIKNKRKKRLLDVISSLLFIVIIPILILVVKNPIHFLRNLMQVLLGKKSWVGYAASQQHITGLPKLKPAPLNPTDARINSTLSDENIQKLNVLYAKDYRWINDAAIIWRALRNLGK